MLTDLLYYCLVWYGMIGARPSYSGSRQTLTRTAIHNASICGKDAETATRILSYSVPLQIGTIHLRISVSVSTRPRMYMA